jgi:hypothetical protein
MSEHGGFPADCVIFKDKFEKYNGSQQMAEFQAGSRSLPAKTGKDNNNNTAVINTAHANTII